MLLSILCSSCRTRAELGSIASDTNSASGLDLMDIAVLYPPPGGNELHSWPRFLFRKEREQGAYNSIGNDTKRDQKILHDLSERAFWPPLFSQDRALMPRSAFDKIIEVGQGRPPDIKGAGISYKIKALSKQKNFFGQDKTVYDVEVDMSEADRWRVSSFRFDPCPYSVYHGLPGKENESGDYKDSSGSSVTSGVNENRAGRERLCQPEFRLVVQPFLGRTETETQLGAALPFIGALLNMQGGNPTGTALDQVKGKGRGWFAADYAIHLFYRLSRDESEQMARKLLELKRVFNGVCPTTAVPMQVHPCLVSEALNVGKSENISFAQSLFDIYYPYVGGLHKAAVWGSRVNASPWSFFVGDIKDGPDGQKTFVPARIKPLDAFSFDNQAERSLGDGVDVDLSSVANPNSSLSKSAQAKSEKLADASLLTQSKAMFFDRNTGFPRQVITDGQAYQPNASTYRKRRMNPPPKPDKDSLAVFVMGQVGFQTQEIYRKIISEHNFSLGLHSISSPLDRSTDLLKVTSRIENPVINNEFKVDCASCHMSNMEASNARMGIRASIRKMGEKQTEVTQSLWQSYLAALENGMDQHGGVNQASALYPVEHYWGPQGLSTFRTASSTVALKGTRTMVYVLNQFSYYAEQPMVSSRVMNEVADSADFANRHLLKASPPFKGMCDRKQLDMCLTGLGGRELKRDGFTVDMGIEPYHFDWYQAFLDARQRCLAPERGICTYPD